MNLTYLLLEIAVFMVAALVFIFLMIFANHTDGVIHVRQGEEKDSYLFEFNIPPEKIPTMKTVVFKVSIEEDHSQNIQPM